MTTLRAGSASDVGQVRSINQDAPMVVASADLYGVADGMGGHQGGEVASALAIEITQEHATEPTLASLMEAVRLANRAIFERAGGDRDLHGMGTTLVAVRLVDGPDGDEIAWVNVGDSRVYLFRDGRLLQLSEDHSLVEDLVRDGQITADEAAVHPQRNILTRALGIDVDVVVDGNTVLPFTGDRYLLCSDGLFNEVSTDDMTSVLRTVEDPDEAAAELVRHANQGGGRDNITVVIVDVVDDGGRAAAASAAGAEDPTTILSAVPVPVGTRRTDGGDDAPSSGVAAEDATTVDLDQPAGTEGAGPSPGPGDGHRGASDLPSPDRDETTDEGPAFAGARSSLPESSDAFGADGDDLFGDLNKARTRHLTWRVIGFLLILLLIAGAVVGYIAFDWNRSYYVTYEKDQVALRQGKPADLLWFTSSPADLEPKIAAITKAETPEVRRAEIEADKAFTSEEAARKYLRNLYGEVDDIDASSTSTTTVPAATSTTPASTTTAPAAPTTTSKPGP